MERKFDGGELQLVITVKDAPPYSKPTYPSEQTIRATGSHATEPIRTKDPNRTVASATRAAGSR